MQEDATTRSFKATTEPLTTKKNFGNSIAAGIDRMSEIMGSFAGYIMLMISIIICLEIILRAFFKSPTIWVYDISCYGLVWFAFCASSYGIKNGNHICVDLFTHTMKPRTKVPLDIITYVLITGYSMILFFYSAKMCLGYIRTMEVAPTALATPVFLIVLGMVIGTFFMVTQTILELCRLLERFVQGNLEGGTGFNNNPYFVFPAYIILVAIGVWLYVHVPAAGLIMLVLVLLAVGLPVFTSLGVIGVMGLYILLGPTSAFSQAATVASSSMESFVILALPLYVLAGEILMKGGIGQELFDVAFKWVGHLPGGLAVATITACAIFAAISGSSVATAAAIGIIALPEMLKHGYDKRLAYGVLAAGGTLGIMIPPSGAMIIYSSITDESTGALFVGGVLPGIMLAILFAGYAAISCYHTGKYDKVSAFSWKDRALVLKSSIWAILAPLLIIGSIYSGLCTATEAAALSVVYALIVSLARRNLSFSDLNKVMATSTRSSCMVLMIIVGALIMGAIVTFLQIPPNLVAWIKSLGVANWVVMLFLTIIYIILGMFLEVASILLITIPIFYPLIKELGYNGVWFGVCVVALMELALITPPVGLNLFVIQGIGKASLKDVSIGAFAFMILLLAGLLIMWFFPQIVLYLPGTMGYH
jgi:C4-dicarboxylate transporter, DctM subunit